MRIRTVAVAAALLMSLIPLSACSDNKDSSSDAATQAGADPEVQAMLPDGFVDKGVFKVALFENAPPDAYKEGDEIIGWQADIARAVGDVFGVTTEIIPSSSFESLIPGLQAGRFDSSFSSFYITEERLEIADFASVALVGTGFGVTKESGITITEPMDMCGHSGATLAGSTFIDQLVDIGEQCEAAGKEGVEVQTYPSNSASVLAATTGRVDVFVTSSNEIASLVEQSPDTLVKQELIYEPKILAEAFLKDNPLAPVTVAAINVLIEDGRYQAILDKYQVSDAAITASELNPI